MALLIHAGGWDEVIMVAAGLVIAWVIIRFTGRGEGDIDEEAGAGGDAAIDASRTADTRSDPAEARAEKPGMEDTR